MIEIVIALEEPFVRLGVKAALEDAEDCQVIGVIIDEDMAYAVKMFDHRHACLAADPFNEAFAAARYDDIDISLHCNQLTNCGAVCCFAPAS